MTPGEAAHGCTRACGASACKSPPLISVSKRLQRLGSGGLHICHALALYGPPEGSLSSCVDQVMLLLAMATFSDHLQCGGLDRNSSPTPSAQLFLYIFLVPLWIFCKTSTKELLFSRDRSVRIIVGNLFRAALLDLKYSSVFAFAAYCIQKTLSGLIWSSHFPEEQPNVIHTHK